MFDYELMREAVRKVSQREDFYENDTKFKHYFNKGLLVDKLSKFGVVGVWGASSIISGLILSKNGELLDETILKSGLVGVSSAFAAVIGTTCWSSYYGGMGNLYFKNIDKEIGRNYIRGLYKKEYMQEGLSEKEAEERSSQLSITTLKKKEDEYKLDLKQYEEKVGKPFDYNDFLIEDDTDETNNMMDDEDPNGRFIDFSVYNTDYINDIINDDVDNADEMGM